MSSCRIPRILNRGIDGILVVLVLDRPDVSSSVVVVRCRLRSHHFVREGKVESRMRDGLRMREIGSNVE